MSASVAAAKRPVPASPLEGPPGKKRAPQTGFPPLLGGWVLPPVDQEATFCGVVAALRAGGAFWNPKLRRGVEPELKIPGILTQECLEEGELLCRVPAGLHFSRQSCKKLMPEVFVACEQLPSAVPEKREEAADALCMALLLLGARARLLQRQSGPGD
ncbi:unnamed protein product, partial [Polarella glacialis]